MISLLKHLRSRLQYKLVLPFALLTVIVAVLGGSGAFLLTSNSLQERFDNQLASVARTANDALMSQEQANLQFLREVAFAQSNEATGAPAVAEALASGDAAGLALALDPFFRVGQSRTSVRIDRLIAFDLSGLSMVDYERHYGGGNDYTVRQPQDLSATWYVELVLANTVDSRGDKYAGLIDLADAPIPYFATIAPVRQGDVVVGGLVAAIRLDTLMTDLMLSSQAAGIAVYDQSGRPIASTFGLTPVGVGSVKPYSGDLSARGAADYSYWPESPLLPPINPEAVSAPDAAPAPENVPVAVIALTPASAPTMQLTLTPASIPVIRPTLTVSTPVPRAAPPLDAHLPQDLLAEIARYRQASGLFAVQTINAREYQFAYIPLSIRGSSTGIMAIGLSRDYLSATAGDALYPIMAVVFGLVLMIGGSGFFITREITRPIEQFTAAARAITSGDLRVRAKVHSDDEIGVLARSFNQMTEYLIRLYGQVQSEASQRAAIVESQPDGIIVCDDQGKIQLVNLSTRRLLGLGVEDAIPNQLSDVPLRRLDDGSPISRMLGGRDLYALGDTVVQVSIAPIVNAEGGRTGYVCTLHDMQYELAVEERFAGLTQANEAVYRALAQGLGAEDLAAVAAYTRPELPASGAGQLPAGLEAALAGFDALSATVRAYQVATAPTIQRDLMLQAGAQVEEIAGMAGRLAEPFGSLLALMISRWRPLIAEEGGRLARAELSGPVPNPYVAGNPVRGALFIGREDVLRRLRELWGGDGQRPSVILFGHRRMGKSSILHNLGGWLGADTLVITINLQRLGLIASTGDLLYTLAEAIHAALPADAQNALGPPDEIRFLERNPYTALDQYLRRLDAARGGLRLLLALDEFEKLEEWIAAGRVEPQLLDALRGLIQTYPWFVLALAGLHTLEEMTHDYWNPLFGSITAIPVSFLSPEGARRLITQPSPEFAINYAPDAVAQIVGLTNGQPYLVQLIGHALVTRFNRQSFEEGIERERRFTVDDVAAVIGAPEFHRDGHAYFDGVWNQARQSQPPGQERLLGALAAHPAGLDEPALLRASGLDPALGRQALAVLAAHDVVAQAGGRYRFTVELMRRWVAQEQQR